MSYFFAIVAYGVGCAFYATRFPECNKTGKYDYLVQFINFLIIY